MKCSLVLISILLNLCLGVDEYCKKSSSHLLCPSDPVKPASNCPSNFKSYEMTQKMKKKLAKKFNTKRTLAAKGMLAYEWKDPVNIGSASAMNRVVCLLYIMFVNLCMMTL